MTGIVSGIVSTLQATERHHFEQGALRMDGATLRDQVIGDISAAIAVAGSPTVGLATLVVGDDPASATYVGLKHRAAERAGMSASGTTLPGDVSQNRVDEAVRRLNVDPAVHGILVQLPLPAGLDETRVIDLIDPAKDVDGLTSTNLARLVRGVPDLVPCTPLAVLRLLGAYGVVLEGRSVTIVGRTPLVGIPLSLLLASEGVGATVTLCGGDSPDVAARCRAADVVVSDVGRPHLIGDGWIRPGAAVVDVGVSRPAGRLIGDVDTEAVAAVAGALAPNPGGAGPMTIACLLENTLRAARDAGALGT